MTHVPEQTIGRLPLYLRCLRQARGIGMPVINSLNLAQMAGTNAAQVRKDLSYLGELGTRGIGYDVESLMAHISAVLGLTEKRRVAIVGFGRLGAALLGYPGFSERGFDIVAVFDSDPAKIGTEEGSLRVSPLEVLEEVLQDLKVEIVILATPTSAAQVMAQRVADAGIRAIMNFTHERLDLHGDVRIQSVDLSVELQVLSFYLERSI